ncbi:hypothetical protein BCV69DRAFT_278329 [Microstroma glucosiphilum]|uniref:Uncharacterized protein n=1 Tax=Pseudomicrostroma glucosiphilum TaxID=1684307 RepID=A0A316U846_9BASI|nr:hypothetical protein BCV69DRAFT_278329 [Pseudomicrostroma glucosiphilum]PWN19145.1 hypothetical protein BCV69DRAFT_278329 [Pseudomicrostroma glucosiphilum]
MIALRAILLLAALLSVHIATARAINPTESQSNAKRFGVGIPVGDDAVAVGQTPNQGSSEVHRRFSFSNGGARLPGNVKTGGDQIGIAGRGEKPARRFSLGGLTGKTHIPVEIGIADRDTAEQPGAERRVFVSASQDDFWHGAVADGHSGSGKVHKEGLFSFAGVGAGVGIASTSIERAHLEVEEEGSVEQEKRFSFSGGGSRVGIAGAAEENEKRFSFAGMGGRVGIAGIAEKRAAAAAAAAEDASAKRAAAPHPLN